MPGFARADELLEDGDIEGAAIWRKNSRYREVEPVGVDLDVSFLGEIVENSNGSQDEACNFEHRHALCLLVGPEPSGIASSDTTRTPPLFCFADFPLSL